MEFTLNTDYDLSTGAESDSINDATKRVTSPRLEAKKATATATAAKKLFSFGKGKKTEEVSDEALDNMSEDKVNDMLEELGEDDFKDAAGFIVNGLDFAIEKALNNFFNRTQKIETPAQKQKLERMKIVGKKILMKWGVKFKLEFLFLLMFCSFTYSRYKDADIIDPTKVKDKGNKEGKIIKMDTSATVEKAEEAKTVKSEESEVKSTPVGERKSELGESVAEILRRQQGA